MTRVIRLPTGGRRLGGIALAALIIGASSTGTASSSPRSLHPPQVEQWRALVAEHWSTRGYADEVDFALMVLFAESSGDPRAVNSTSGASGLFQHLPEHWESRSARAGLPGADILDPEANVAVAAWLRATDHDDGWLHWEAVHNRFPVGSWGPETHWDQIAGGYVQVGGGAASPGGVFDIPSSASLTLESRDPVPDGSGDWVWTVGVHNRSSGTVGDLFVWHDPSGEAECAERSLPPGASTICTVDGSPVARSYFEVFAWDEDGLQMAARAPARAGD